MASISASEWIARVDDAREARLGVSNTRVAADPMPKDFTDYPRAHKHCVVCGTRSVNRVALDGLNYYCTRPTCRAARARRADRLRRD